MFSARPTSLPKPKSISAKTIITKPSRFRISNMSYSTLKMDVPLMRSNSNSNVFARSKIDHTHAETKWMEFEEWGQIRYHVVGKGPHTLVLVSGLLANWMIWKYVIPILAPKYRLVMPDLPLGAHTKPVKTSAKLTPDGVASLIAKIVTRIHEEDPCPITLVSQDTGGALSQIAIANHPEMPLHSAVFCSCDAFEHFLPLLLSYAKYVGKIPFNFILRLYAYLLKFKIIRNFPLIFGWLFKKGLDDKEILDAITLPLRSSSLISRDMRKILSSISSKYTLEAAEKLKNFQKPVLIAWSKDDKIFPKKDAERFAKVIPNSELKWIEDSYAFSMVDQPETLSKYIDDFVSKNTKSN